MLKILLLCILKRLQNEIIYDELALIKFQNSNNDMEDVTLN